MMSFWYVLHVILLVGGNWVTVPFHCTPNRMTYGCAVLLASDSMIPTMCTVANADATFTLATDMMASELLN